ncbi:MAG: TraR/DksA family transcriptional regulator [Kiritimatiellaceae bacterium]|nr:MAG: TraR/DksA family transcriptional regulator [Kiritimatiellaceae bacterium]
MAAKKTNSKKSVSKKTPAKKKAVAKKAPAKKKAVAKKAPAKKKAAAKKAVAKKAPAKKAVAKKAPAKKAPAKKKALAKKAPAKKKAVAKKAPVKKKAAAKKAPAKKKTAAKKKSSSPISGGTLSGKIGRNKHFSAKQLKEQLNRLLLLRERVTGEILSINRDSLSQNERDPSLSDQGTDTFDREFALNQLSSEQDVLFEIDEAIRRIENGTYGICEMTSEPINIERLEALPYVRHSIKAQSELEKGHHRYRPFGNTMHGM